MAILLGLRCIGTAKEGFIIVDDAFPMLVMRVTLF